jgi:hypothetical protein
MDAVNASSEEEELPFIPQKLKTHKAMGGQLCCPPFSCRISGGSSGAFYI